MSASGVPTLRGVTAQMLRIRRKQRGKTQTEAAVEVAAIAEMLGYPPRRVEQTTFRYWETPDSKGAKTNASGIEPHWWVPLSIWVGLEHPLNFAFLLMCWSINLDLGTGTQSGLNRLEDEADALQERMAEYAKKLPGHTPQADVRPFTHPLPVTREDAHAAFDKVPARNKHNRDELSLLADQVYESLETLVQEVWEYQIARGIPTLNHADLLAGNVEVTIEQSLAQINKTQDHLDNLAQGILREMNSLNHRIGKIEDGGGTGSDRDVDEVDHPLADDKVHSKG